MTISTALKQLEPILAAVQQHSVALGMDYAKELEST